MIESFDFYSVIKGNRYCKESSVRKLENELEEKRELLAAREKECFALWLSLKNIEESCATSRIRIDHLSLDDIKGKLNENRR